MTLRTLALAATLLITPACQNQIAGQPRGHETTDGAMIIAEIYGKSITAAELDEWIRNDLFDRETRGRNPAAVYKLRATAVDKMIDQRVLDTEASRLDQTQEELMESEIAALGEVTDEEIETFYNETTAQMGDAALEEIAPQIRAYLRKLKEVEVLAHLRQQANATILLEPIRYQVAADGPSKGPADAQVTIIEFSDFQCPFCKRASPTVDRILRKYPKDVRLVYRHLPLASHPRARPAADAAVCADGQGKFWQYHDTLFESNGKLADDDLLRYAADLGLDIDQFKLCLTSTETSTKVQADLDAAKTAGVSGTPAFLINGIFLSGARPAKEFINIIEAELAALAQ